MCGFAGKKLSHYLNKIKVKGVKITPFSFDVLTLHKKSI